MPSLYIKAPNLYIKTPNLYIKTPSLSIKTPSLYIKTPSLSIKMPSLSIKTPPYFMCMWDRMPCPITFQGILSFPFPCLAPKNNLFLESRGNFPAGEWFLGVFWGGLV